MSDQNIAIHIDALHLRFARNCTTSRRLTVFSALNDSVSPDFVWNLMVVGFFTVLIATNLTFFFGIAVMVSPSLDHRAGSLMTLTVATISASNKVESPVQALERCAFRM